MFINVYLSLMISLNASDAGLGTWDSRAGVREVLKTTPSSVENWSQAGIRQVGNHLPSGKLT
jgi:hypothetical protein